MGPDTGYYSSAPQITFSFSQVSLSISSLIIWFVAPVTPESCKKYYYWTGLLAPLQTNHRALLYSPKVHRSDDILPWLISGSGLFFNVGLGCFYFVVYSLTFPSTTFSCLLPWLPFLVSFVICFPNWGFPWELVYSLPCWVILVTYFVWVCTPWLGLVFSLLPVAPLSLLASWVSLTLTAWILGGFYLVSNRFLVTW